MQKVKFAYLPTITARQIVISGSVPGIEKACELMKAAGAKRALPLKVGGAFHSPLMDPAKVELEAAINATEIHTPKCPVYQNVDALPHTDPAEIKKNLVAQLTASVRWTQSVKNMVADGATDFTECGPGAVLQGLIKKIDGQGSALKALEDPNSEWGDKILELMHTIDGYVPDPERDTDKPFLMPVEDVFSITGRGTVATGRVERGVLHVNEEVEIVGIHEDIRKVVVTGIEMFRKLLDEAQPGDNIGALLRGVQRDEIQRGHHTTSLQLRFTY